MPLKLHFIYFDGDEVDLIPESVKRRLRKFALAMGRCTEIPHKLEVQFLPAAVLTGDGKDLNWGHFFIENDLPVIQLACLWTLLIYLTGEMMVSAALIVAFVGLVLMSFALAWLLDERAALKREIRGLEFDNEIMRQSLASWQGVSHGWATQKILTTETYT